MVPNIAKTHITVIALDYSVPALVASTTTPSAVPDGAIPHWLQTDMRGLNEV
jgi:hypothetical protein